MALERELETYSKHLPTFVKETGKFVLIQGEEIVGFFTSYEDAIKAGYGKFGLTPFLVKQVSSAASIQYITRYVKPVTHSRVAA